MRTVPVNRLRELMIGNEPHPGTPDNEVSMIRLAAREAFRSGHRFVASRELPVAEGHRVEFWNGYYDEQLGYLFGRGVKPS